MSLNVMSYLVRTGTVGFVALLLMDLLRRQSAAKLHAIASASLIAMLVLVPASFVVSPRLKPIYVTAVPVPSAFTTTTQVTESPSLSEAESGAPFAGRRGVRVAQSLPEKAVPQISKLLGAVDPLQVLVATWVVGVGLLLGRLVAAISRIARRVSRSTALPGLSEFEVLVDKEATVPVAVWCGKSIILLPPTWTSWSRDRLDTVLKHEAAHLERGDCLIQLLATTACAVAWPNPFAWRLLRVSRRLSEQAVDDSIIQSGVSPSAYAQDLLDIAHQSKDRLSGLALPMAVKPEVSRRIELILDDRRQKGAVTFAAILAMGVGFGGLAIGVSEWGLVPANTMAAIKRSLPSPVAEALSSSARLDVHLPSSFKGLTLLQGSSAGVMSNRPAAIEPHTPAEEPVVESNSGVRTDIYLIDTSTNLARYGVYKGDFIRFGSSYSLPKSGLRYMSKSQASSLRKELEKRGARRELSMWMPRSSSQMPKGTFKLGPEEFTAQVARTRTAWATSPWNYLYVVQRGNAKQVLGTEFVAVLAPGRVTPILKTEGVPNGLAELWIVDPQAESPSQSEQSKIQQPIQTSAPLEQSQKSLAKPGGTQELTSLQAAPPAHKYKVLAQLYRVNSDEQLKRFGINGMGGTPAGSSSVDEASLGDLRAQLDTMGAAKLTEFSLSGPDGEAAQIQPKGVDDLVSLAFAPRLNPDGSITLWFKFGYQPGPSTQVVTMVQRVKAGHSSELIFPIPGSGGKFDMWVFDVQEPPITVAGIKSPWALGSGRHSLPPSPDLPNAKQIVMRVQEFVLPPQDEHAVHLSLEPPKGKLFGEGAFSGSSLASLKSYLIENGKVINSPVIRNLTGQKATFESSSNDTQTHIELTLDDRMRLWTRICQRADAPGIPVKEGHWDRTYDSDRVYAHGTTRAVVGSPDPKSKVVCVWLISVDPIKE